MDVIKKVLQAYTIYPLTIEQKTARLFHVYDGKREYALKRSSLSEQNIKQWGHVYQLAHSQNLSSILPVYLTKEGKLYKEMDHTIFYLAPWIPVQSNERTKQSIEEFYYTLGNIHAKTKQSRLIQIDQLKRNFTAFQKDCDEAKAKILDDVKQFEKNRYMSPFELLVCTQYRDFEFAVQTMTKRIDQFLYEDKEQIEWNSCLCHGDLTFSHVLNAYIINWEQAHHDNAVLDLANFFQHETGLYDNQTDLFIELFPTYNKLNELTLKEHFLLIIYLLNPTPYITKVQEYRSGSSETIVNQIKVLQHLYRKLIFGIKWSKYVEKEYETISLDDLES